MTPFNAVLFDLDGTLIDTAPDIAAALNRLLAHHQLPELPYEALRSRVFGGSEELLGAAFDISKSHPEYASLRDHFLALCAEEQPTRATLFPGMAEVISMLEQHQIPWGVVTNKYMNMAKPVMDFFPELKNYQCLIAGDTLPVAKPHPEPLLHACKQLNLQPQHTLYIGDSESDSLAAKAANMPFIAATYGYTPQEQDPHQWPAVHYLEKPLDFITWFTENKPE